MKKVGLLFFSIFSFVHILTPFFINFRGRITEILLKDIKIYQRSKGGGGGGGGAEEVAEAAGGGHGGGGSGADVVEKEKATEAAGEGCGGEGSGVEALEEEAERGGDRGG